MTLPQSPRLLSAVGIVVLVELLAGALLLPRFPDGPATLLAFLALLFAGIAAVLILGGGSNLAREEAEQRLAENVESLERTNRELVEARAEVVRTAKLASVGTLAAGIAHEIGNPLGAIMGFVDVASSRAKRGEVDPEILDSIRDEARRIDRIVRGLLDYARPTEQGLGEHTPASVLERVRVILGTQGKLDETDNVWDLAEGVPDVVLDPHRLEQVIINLYLNSLDALSGTSGACITVRVFADVGDIRRMPRRRDDDPPGIDYMHRRRVSQDEGGRGVDAVFSAERVVVIEVSDNGPGIPEDDLERVFDPFFTTKEPGAGTGLGLSICARLIEGMGGRIDVDNGPDGGARFQIRLPGINGAEEAAR